MSANQTLLGTLEEGLPDLGTLADPFAVVELDTQLSGGVRYYFGHGVLPLLSTKLEEYLFDKLYLVTSPTVWDLHGRELTDLLERSFHCESVLIPDSEVSKNATTLNNLCEELIQRGVSKDSILLSLGGGVVGNIVGLSAALVYRGIRFVEIPTTTIGQTDSCLSNKQGINGLRGKNHFGVYYAPLFIWADSKLLVTESPRARRSGLVESVKNGLISDPAFLTFLEERLQSGVMFPEDTLREVVYCSVLSKTRILERDPSEKGYGVILEYGHTIGHAVERLSNGGLTHGEAVALGMMAEAMISNRLGLLSRTDVERHRYLLGDLLGIDLTLPFGVSVEEVLETIEADNKRTARGIRYVLLESIGNVFNPEGDYTISLDPRIVSEVLFSLSGRSPGVA